MKLLVTGGAGYIGSHMVRLLLEKGFTPLILDNFATGDERSIPNNVEVIRGDLRDRKFVDSVFLNHQISAIFHFAASTIVPDSVLDPISYYENNVIGSLNLISAAHQFGVHKFIFSSTAAVYGNPAVEIVTENSPIQPMSPYGSSKYMTEQILRDISKAHPKFKAVILRYFNVAGAKSDRMLGSFAKNATHLIKVCAEMTNGKRDSVKIFGTNLPTPDGTCIRDYIHVEDLTEAHLCAFHYLNSSTSKNIDTETFNLGYGRGYSVHEVITEFKKIAPNLITIPDAPRLGDPIKIVANNQKALQILGWTPKHDSLFEICQSAYLWEKNF